MAAGPKPGTRELQGFVTQDFTHYGYLCRAEASGTFGRPQGMEETA
jgi:hypothetical protein